MRVNTISISEIDLMFVIGGQLFCQAPNRQPRQSEIIMQKVRDFFRNDAYNDNEFYSLRIPESEVYNYLKNIMMSIPEFVDLNLSQIEFDKKISVNDENRPKYAFYTRYDKNDSETWKRDFVDLDAFIRNVHRRLYTIMDSDQDCFCCKKQKSEDCKTCLVNPDLKYNYECSRKPKGKYTFSCKFDCKMQCQICCEECTKKDTCNFVCDGNSKECGNKVMD